MKGRGTLKQGEKQKRIKVTERRKSFVMSRESLIGKYNLLIDKYKNNRNEVKGVKQKIVRKKGEKRHSVKRKESNVQKYMLVKQAISLKNVRKQEKAKKKYKLTGKGSEWIKKYGNLEYKSGKEGRKKGGEKNINKLKQWKEDSYNGFSLVAQNKAIQQKNAEKEQGKTNKFPQLIYKEVKEEVIKMNNKQKMLNNSFLIKMYKGDFNGFNGFNEQDNVQGNHCMKDLQEPEVQRKRKYTCVIDLCNDEREKLFFKKKKQTKVQKESYELVEGDKKHCDSNNLAIIQDLDAEIERWPDAVIRDKDRWVYIDAQIEEKREETKKLEILRTISADQVQVNGNEVKGIDNSSQEDDFIGQQESTNLLGQDQGESPASSCSESDQKIDCFLDV